MWMFPAQECVKFEQHMREVCKQARPHGANYTTRTVVYRQRPHHVEYTGIYGSNR